LPLEVAAMPTTAGLIIVSAAVAGLYLWLAPAHALRPLIRPTVNLGADALADEGMPAVLSPDGRRLVYRVAAPDGKPYLGFRLLDQSHAILAPRHRERFQSILFS